MATTSAHRRRALKTCSPVNRSGPFVLFGYLSSLLGRERQLRNPGKAEDVADDRRARVRCYPARPGYASNIHKLQGAELSPLKDRCRKRARDSQSRRTSENALRPAGTIETLGARETLASPKTGTSFISRGSNRVQCRKSMGNPPN